MSVLLWSGWDERKPSDDVPNQEKNQYWIVYWWNRRTLCIKMWAKVFGKIEEDKMLAPKVVTIGGNVKPEQQPV